MKSTDQKRCIVCCDDFIVADQPGSEEVFGANLLGRSIMKTVVVWGMCPRHESMLKDGYVHLVVIRDRGGNANKLKPEEVEHTGRVLHMKKKGMEDFLPAELFEDMIQQLHLVSVLWIDEITADKIAELYTKTTGEKPETDYVKPVTMEAPRTLQ